MCIRILTGFVACIASCCSLLFAQTAGIQFKADRVVVIKGERVLQLFKDGKMLKSYKVALGGDPVGPKTRQGDHKTPEGNYILDSRNVHSQYYRSIHISYPNEHDQAAARQKGVSPGGDIFVHGLPKGYGWVGSGHRLKDWTDECIAVTNEEIDEIWKAVPNELRLRSVLDVG